MNDDLQTRITNFLSTRSFVADFNPFSGNVTLQDDSDGNGPFITKWADNLPQPSPSEGFSVYELHRLTGVSNG